MKLTKNYSYILNLGQQNRIHNITDCVVFYFNLVKVKSMKTL